MRNLQTLAAILKIDRFLTKPGRHFGGLKAFSSAILLLSFIFYSIGCVQSPPADSSARPFTPEINSWQPRPNDRLQIQYADYPPDLSVDADVYSVDLFETSQESIDQLHAAGKKVICYLNTGSWEEYRPDAGDFPTKVVGNDYEGWPGEKWLDIRHYADFALVMEKRFDLAMEKGCDGIDADNMQNFNEDTGFNISAADQLAYNRWLSQQAHQRGLAIGLKNDLEQAAELVEAFDWALIEDCQVYGWCSDMLPFTQTGKAVFQVEYSDNWASPEQFCGEALTHGYSALFKNRELDAWVSYCDLPESE
jgi:hypothetical protein